MRRPVQRAKTAAAYELLIDMHDDVRPFGHERTYPNWISLEGVRGNEQFQAVVPRPS